MSCSTSVETKLSGIKTRVKTLSLFHKYDISDISRKSPEGSRQAFAQSGEEGEDTCTERTLGFYTYYYYY